MELGRRKFPKLKLHSPVKAIWETKVTKMLFSILNWIYLCTCLPAGRREYVNFIGPVIAEAYCVRIIVMSCQNSCSTFSLRISPSFAIWRCNQSYRFKINVASNQSKAVYDDQCNIYI